MKKRLLCGLIVVAFVAALLPAAPAQAVSTEILKPTAYSDPAGRWSSQAYAYDGTSGSEDTTCAASSSLVGADPSITYTTWATPAQSHTARRLYIRRASSEFGNDSWDLYYSTDGGSGWIAIETGNKDLAKGNTAAASIDTALDLGNLQVKVVYTQQGGADSAAIQLWDIWLEGDYTYITSPKVGTQIGAEYPITLSPSAMTPQEEWTSITVPVQDDDTLADVNEVKVKLFYDSAGTDPDEAGFSAAVQTCAILTWTRGGSPEWDIAPASTTWAINTAGCSKPLDSATQGNWVFSFKVGKVASHSPGTDDWDIHAKATDAGSSTGEDYLRDKEMNWYGEITVNTASVDWGSVGLDTGFTEEQKVIVSITYICNGNFNKQIKASSPWGSSPTVTLNPTGIPGAGEFSLKADDDLTLGGAGDVSTTYTTIGTGTQTDESGTTEVNNSIWLKTGSSGITTGVSYDGTIYYGITQ